MNKTFDILTEQLRTQKLEFRTQQRGKVLENLKPYEFTKGERETYFTNQNCSESISHHLTIKKGQTVTGVCKNTEELESSNTASGNTEL